MSYLDSTHLTFSGDFIADVSTVNNDPAHYNNDTFVPSFQQPALNRTNGWWNPEGGATFNFQNCKVMQVSVHDGSIATNDIINNTIVCGAEGRNTGKLVDLDPQQQMVSELWGVKLRIITNDNNLVFEGDIKNTSFRDLQIRQYNMGPNGQQNGATWTSVIENVVWGDLLDSSPFLKELKAKTLSNKLSINLNAYGYYYTHEVGRFSMGRLLGAIGPWYDDEPKTFAACRRLYGTNPISSQQYSITNTNFLCQNNLLTIDFGSSFPISDALGSIAIQDKIFLAVSKIYVNQQSFISKEDCIMIGEIDYKTGPDWLNDTSGIVTFSLKEEVENQLKNHQLLLLVSASSGGFTIVSREALDGIVVRADNFVNRIDYSQTANIEFYAYQWGRSLNNVAININLEAQTPSYPKNDPNGSPICFTPSNNCPPEGITFNPSITTNDKGIAVLKVTGNRIDNPRVYIDGQIYFLDYQIALTNQPDTAIPQSDKIFIHLRNYFEIPENPEWSDISQTMIQFSNLYPIMSKYFINLGDPNAVISKKDLLIFAFTRDISDPVYMPATRDLSENKKQTILKWLRNHDVNNVGDITPAVASNESSGCPDIEVTPITNYRQQLKDIIRSKSGADLK